MAPPGSGGHTNWESEGTDGDDIVGMDQHTLGQLRGPCDPMGSLSKCLAVPVTAIFHSHVNLPTLSSCYTCLVSHIQVLCCAVHTAMCYHVGVHLQLHDQWPTSPSKRTTRDGYMATPTTNLYYLGLTTDIILWGGV
jgi:hypothetical protein